MRNMPCPAKKILLNTWFAKKKKRVENAPYILHFASNDRILLTKYWDFGHSNLNLVPISDNSRLGRKRYVKSPPSLSRGGMVEHANGVQAGISSGFDDQFPSSPQLKVVEAVPEGMYPNAHSNLAVVPLVKNASWFLRYKCFSGKLAKGGHVTDQSLWIVKLSLSHSSWEW